MDLVELSRLQFAVTALYGFKIMSCLTTGRTYRLPGIPVYGNRCVSLYVL